MNLLARYNEALRIIPFPGGGGCHSSILGVANLGVLAGLTAETIFQDLRQSIPSGSRKVSDGEISDAIRKALSDHNGGTYTPRPRPEPVVRDGKATRQRIIDQGKILDEADFWEASPIRLLEEPKDDPALLLETLYEPTDLLWIGEHDHPGVLGKTIRTAADWITYFRNGGKTAPHIIPNPMSGQEGTTKTGESSFRSDDTVKTYRFCLVEFDDLPREFQIRFWSAVRLPVVCLIDSGGKSIHAWLDVQKWTTVETPDQWQAEIKQHLYDRLLAPLGVDKACSNPARLSRLPGHYRIEKGNYQRTLWLSGREGRFIV
jgi:hypothetical protein